MSERKRTPLGSKEHDHVFGKWRANSSEFCAVCDMPKGGWTTFPVTPPASETVDAARLGDGPVIGPLTPKQVRILDHRHHRVTNSRLCACGQVWAHCEVHRLIETFKGRAESDERVAALRKAAEYVCRDWFVSLAVDGDATLQKHMVALRAALDAGPEDAHKP